MTSGLEGIVPRWEWRTFGSDFGRAETDLAMLERERVQESDEAYLLSVASDASVKIRDDLMDVKRLVAVDRSLEQWRPVLKAPFPLAPGDVSSLLEELGVPSPELDPDPYSLDELLQTVVEPAAGLRVAQVHKHREHYRVNGCMAELTEVRSDARTIRTLAIESEDPERLIATVRLLGLEGQPNVCFSRGLKELVGLGAAAATYAAIDVGTNSVKFYLAERGADGAWRDVADRAEITRLGEGLEATGRLAPAAIERTVDAIAGMAEEARQHDAVAIAAVGTAGLRLAANATAFVDCVRERCGVEVEVIPGEEEAQLAYLAATAELGTGPGAFAVFDTGGGSTQFTFGSARQVVERFSVDLGAVRLTETFGLGGVVSTATVQAARAAIAADLARLDGRAKPDVLIGLGGAATNLAAVSHALAVYDPLVVRGTVLDRAEIDRQIELYRSKPAEERRWITGLQPKRAEVILAGALVVRTVLDELDCESFAVSDRGLRHRLVVERFDPSARPPRPARTPRTRATA